MKMNMNSSEVRESVKSIIRGSVISEAWLKSSEKRKCVGRDERIEKFNKFAVEFEFHMGPDEEWTASFHELECQMLDINRAQLFDELDRMVHDDILRNYEILSDEPLAIFVRFDHRFMRDGNEKGPLMRGKLNFKDGTISYLGYRCNLKDNPALNELAKYMFGLEIDSPVGKDLVFSAIQGIDEEEVDLGRDMKHLENCIYGLNKKVKEHLRTNDRLIIVKGREVRRQF
jgi:hypothetical protein